MGITDEIKSRLDIVELISSYIPLKKAGRTYKGLCPFHGEKTPSFTVFPESQTWHCFGSCATGGDVFSFVMKRENLDFAEALTLLAAKAGVELQAPTGAASSEEGRLDRLRQIVGDAAVYFHYLLSKAGEAQIARYYLARRGLTQETWEAWQLGYSLDRWDALRERLTGKGYSLADIEEAGLLIRREDGSGYHDRFRGRLMIPIRDAQGRTIAFGARELRPDPARPGAKYINSPQTPLFDKSSVLYGLDMARKAIRDANLVVLVEGYMDVLMSHQVGVSNVVAGMGTALTEAQMRLVKRYSSNLTLALDPDAAGNHAVLRGLETARQELERDWQPVISPTGLVRQESRLKAQLRIAALPDGLDPDELALQDVARWRQVIAEARPIVDYYLALVSREEDLRSAHGKANAVERLAPLIAEVTSPVEREHYIQRLARMTQSDERLVAEQIALTARRDTSAEVRKRSDAEARRSATAPVPGGVTPAPARRSGAAHGAAGLEEHILGSLLNRSDLTSRLDADMIAAGVPPLSADDFERTENRAILSALLLAPPDEDRSLADWLADLPNALQPLGAALLDEARRRPPLPDERMIKDLGDALLRLREYNLRRQIKQIEFLILEDDVAEGFGPTRQYHELMVAYSAQKRQMHKLLDARSMSGAVAQAQRKS